MKYSLETTTLYKLVNLMCDNVHICSECPLGKEFACNFRNCDDFITNNKIQVELILNNYFNKHYGISMWKEV